MIYMVNGKQGSGKTVFAVKMCYKFFKEGKKIYSNVKLNFPFEPIKISDVVDCKYYNAVVLLDEGHLLLSSRMSMRARNIKIVDGFVSQIRKQRLILIIISQLPRKLDIRIREEADIKVFCTRYQYIKKKRMWSLISHNQEFPKDVPIMINCEMLEMNEGKTKKVHFLANPIYKLYDTYEIVKIEEDIEV